MPSAAVLGSANRERDMTVASDEKVTFLASLGATAMLERSNAGRVVRVGHVLRILRYVERSELQALVGHEQLAGEAVFAEDSDTDLPSDTHDLDG